MSISKLAQQLASGQLSARDHLETRLAAIDSEEGRRAFVTVNADAARRQADAIDADRKSGRPLPAFAGLTVSVKDLFDIMGEVTRAGSTVLADSAPATQDAAVVARLRSAGFIIIGRTNMTEFAYSGIGMNPHFGDPRSPFQREQDGGRVAGGSSSGSAVSIADGMADATIGSDTGGSTRAPAAFCGIVGMKPSTSRMPSQGVYPLSTSFDAAGPMGHSSACCAILDDIMTGGAGIAEDPFPVRGLRLALPRGYLWDELDTDVAAAMDDAIDRLSAAGASITEISIDILEDLRPANRPVSIVSAEAFEIHRTMLDEKAAGYDPYVAARLRGGQSISAADYIAMTRERAMVYRKVQTITRPFDAVVMPTAPAIPMKLATLTSIETKMKASARALRNTSLANYLDRPAISIPCHAKGHPPVGFSLIGSRGHDRRLLAIATGVEAVIRQLV